MAARTRRTTKTTSRKAPAATKTTRTTSKKQPWYAKYAYTRRQIIYRSAWAILLIFIFFNYRGVFIAASVNGQPVSRLSVVQELEKQQGQGVLDNLINETLIHQKARENNISVTADDVNTRISQIETDLKAQGQDLDQILQLQGMTKDDLNKQIEIQLLVEKILSDKLQFTDKEVTDYVASNSAYYPDTMSDEDKLSDARDQLKQQRLSQEFSTWIKSVRDDANITTYVNY